MSFLPNVQTKKSSSTPTNNNKQNKNKQNNIKNHTKTNINHQSTHKNISTTTSSNKNHPTISQHKQDKHKNKQPPKSNPKNFHQSALNITQWSTTPVHQNHTQTPTTTKHKIPNSNNPNQPDDQTQVYLEYKQ